MMILTAREFRVGHDDAHVGEVEAAEVAVGVIAGRLAQRFA